MGRPPVYNAEYFTHKAGFRNDRRIKAIRARLGMAGYGLVVMLLEVLTDADYTQLDTSELELELLAGDLGVSVTEINELLQLAEKIGFFARNDAGFLICPDLDKALEPVFEKRNRAKNAAQQAKPGLSAAETGLSAAETTQSKGKESRVKEIKEEKEKVKKESGRMFSVFVPLKNALTGDGRFLYPPFWSLLQISPSDYQKWLHEQRKKFYAKFPESWTQAMVDLYRQKWLCYRQKNFQNKLLPESIQTQIENLSHLSETQLRDAINMAIGSGWKTIVIDNHGKSPPNAPASVQSKFKKGQPD